AALANVISFKAAEVKQLVFDNSAAEGCAEVVFDQLGNSLIAGQEERPGFQSAHDVVQVEGPMQIVSAALGLHVDGSAIGETLVGAGTAGDHVDGFDGFHGRRIGGEELHPGVGGTHAVDEDVGAAAAGAIGGNLK